MLITFIGGGNMATALISGLVNPPRAHLKIRVCDPSDQARKHLESTFGVPTFTDAVAATEGADVIVLAVKPQSMPVVLASLKGQVSPDQLVLSIAAGITISSICDELGKDRAVIRSMPNTPALIGHGITGVVAGLQCNPLQREQAEEILSAAGEVVWLEEESQMDAVTAVSGSGPAYFYLLMEILTDCAQEMGLSAGLAIKLVQQTALGAADSAMIPAADILKLRASVTSKGGTTHAAISALEEAGIRDIFCNALKAARDRSIELGNAGATPEKEK